MVLVWLCKLLLTRIYLPFVAKLIFEMNVPMYSKTVLCQT